MKHLTDAAFLHPPGSGKNNAHPMTYAPVPGSMNGLYEIACQEPGCDFSRKERLLASEVVPAINRHLEESRRRGPVDPPA